VSRRDLVRARLKSSGLRFNSTIFERYQERPEKLEVAKSSTELFHHIVLGFEGAFSWFEPSAKNDYTECDGDLELNWNGFGYKTVLEALTRKFPNPSDQLPFDQTVLLNKEVVKVIWNESSSENSVMVICSDHSSFTADHLIWTPSIGVLKERHQKIFVPRLPKEKREAIKEIGFGAVMKVAMYFKKKWWTPETNFTGFHFIWSEHDANLLRKEFPEGPLKVTTHQSVLELCKMPSSAGASLLVDRTVLGGARPEQPPRPGGLADGGHDP
jgi:spermine oxidase